MPIETVKRHKMTALWAVVPVKYLENTKTRLAPVLDRCQRRRFTMEMVREVLQELIQVKTLAGVGVLSNDESVHELAHQLKVRVWHDHADALNPGLQAVAGELAEEGYGIMVVPCDVPVARAEDYRQLLAGHDAGVTLVEASADGGTNAILCDAGLDFLFQFGPGSFNAHVLEAESHGIPLTTTRLPRLQRDIDRPADLRWLLDSEYDCKARDVLRLLLPQSGGVKWMETE